MTRNRTVSLLGLAIAALYLYATTQLQVRDTAVGDPLGPKAFPILLGLSLAGVSFFMLASSVRSREDTRLDTGSDTNEPRASALIIVGGMALSAFIYVSVLDLVGFVPATFIFALSILLIFNRRRTLTNLIVSAGFTASLYLLFDWFLGVALPVSPLLAQ